MPNLTKRDLVVKISNETGLVQHQVFDVIQKTLDHITSALSKGQDVELRNFGVFQVRLSKARVGRNPNIPGSNFAIPPRATVKFKSGKIMRRDVLNLSDSMKREAAKRRAPRRRSPRVAPPQRRLRIATIRMLQARRVKRRLDHQCPPR